MSSSNIEELEMENIQNILKIKLNTAFQHFHFSFGSFFMFKILEVQTIIFQYYCKRTSTGPG